MHENCGNDNIVDIFAGAGATEKSLSQRRGREPVTVKVEFVTARFCLNKPLWHIVSNMCEFELRDQLAAIGIRPDDWYLSEDRSLVLMVEEKEFPHIRDSLTDLLLKLHKASLALQAAIHAAVDAEETVSTSSSPSP